MPALPDEVAPCRAATLQGNPVVAEWSAPDKAAVGNHLNNSTMERAGIITIVPGVVATGLGIYWLIDSGPYAKVRPAGPSFVLAPGLVAGTF
jgi:hypothetical protein